METVMFAMAADKYPVAPALHKMLTYRRPHNTEGERDFIKHFIMPLRPEIISELTNTGGKQTDVPMAFFVSIPDPKTQVPPPIMFTSHVDTVHAKAIKGTRQTVVLKDGLYQKNDNQPLGADDAAGVWLMLNMIHYEVPGVYAFFRGEEVGGIGSTFCAKYRRGLFDGIKCAIAFDRRGTTSIITHQGGERGCSEEFAKSLANVIGMGHTADNTGIYTDTKEFFGLVDNCTNVSVGYEHEHSKNETLNKAYIEQLRDKLIAADWSKLDFTKPKVEDIWSNQAYSRYGSSNVAFDRSYKSEPVVGQRIFEDVEPFCAKDLADVIFDQCEVLPVDLRDKALALCQEIYKRFE
jgi:hypothetical protein